MKKTIYLLKFGGSVITDKDRPQAINFSQVENLCHQISQIKKNHPSLRLIIGNGAGSFGHYFALKHKKNALLTGFSRFGFCEISFFVRKLNLAILEKLLAEGVPSFSLPPASFLISKNQKRKKIFIEPLICCLEREIVGIVFGDIIFDMAIDSVIFSTEKIFRELTKELLRRGYSVDQIIYCSDVDGIYDEKGKVIEKINQENFPEIKKKIIWSVKKFDVTGGILHKIKESLKIAEEFGISSFIFNANKNNNLVKLFEGKTVVGTRIE